MRRVVSSKNHGFHNVDKKEIHDEFHKASKLNMDKQLHHIRHNECSRLHVSKATIDTKHNHIRDLKNKKQRLVNLLCVSYPQGFDA